jgi:hypothetical protein
MHFNSNILQKTAIVLTNASEEVWVCMEWISAMARMLYPYRIKFKHEIWLSLHSY